MHKKNIIFLTILTIFTILLIYLLIIVFNDFQYKNNQNSKEEPIYEFIENNRKVIFSVDKITYFSSANAITNINSNSSFNISQLNQYTDIALFINNNSQDENYTLENTLKSVKLSDINFTLTPSIGNPKLFYKNLQLFAKPEYDKNNEINKELNLNISSENEIDYNTPTLFNNCANPITICYVNSGIKENYTLSENISNITYDGSLLKKCNITLNSISAEISFIITIVNNLDETFTCPVSLQIPLSTEKNTIYDGNLKLTQNVKYKFIKNI